MFNKKLQDMTIGESLWYIVLTMGVCFIPYGLILVVMYWDDIKEFFKKFSKKK